MRRTVCRQTEPTPNIATVHFSQSDAICMGARFPICNRALPIRTRATDPSTPCRTLPNRGDMPEQSPPFRFDPWRLATPIRSASFLSKATVRIMPCPSNPGRRSMPLACLIHSNLAEPLRRSVSCLASPIQVRATLRSISYQVRSPHFKAGSRRAARFPSLKKGETHENEKTIRQNPSQPLYF